MSDRPATEPRTDEGWAAAMKAYPERSMRADIARAAFAWGFSAGRDHPEAAQGAAPRAEGHTLLDGYCVTCNGGCLLGFGNDTDEERCPVDGCDELPEDHHHPACNDPRHDEIEAWYRQALELAAPRAEGLPSTLDIPNPYRQGTMSWITFEQGQLAALEYLRAAPLDMSCDRIVNNGMGEPTECGRSYPCDLHDEGAAPRAEGPLRAALERLLDVAMTEEEDVSPATQDEWIAAIKQANEALE